MLVQGTPQGGEENGEGGQGACQPLAVQEFRPCYVIARLTVQQKQLHTPGHALSEHANVRAHPLTTCAWLAAGSRCTARV